MEASASLEEEEEEGVPPEPSMRRTRSRLDTRTKCPHVDFNSRSTSIEAVTLEYPLHIMS